MQTIEHIDYKTKFVEQPNTLAILRIRTFHGRCAQGHAVPFQERAGSRVRQSKEVSAGVNNVSLSLLCVKVCDH